MFGFKIYATKENGGSTTSSLPPHALSNLFLSPTKASLYSEIDLADSLPEFLTLDRCNVELKRAREARASGGRECSRAPGGAC